MKLLAVETSTEACSAALFIDGDVAERFEISPREHTRLILPMIDGLMAEAGLKPQQLDALALSRGPGSFTGVRIATGIIQGIAFGADLPVVPVSTLAAIAQDFFDHHDEQCFLHRYGCAHGRNFLGRLSARSAGLCRTAGPGSRYAGRTCRISGLAGVGVGSGWGVYHDILMARLAGFKSHGAKPIYCRVPAPLRVWAHRFRTRPGG